MLQSVGPQVLNGWNAFNAAITGGSVPLSDCDFFSVNVIGTWVGTLKWMGSLDNVNWFDMALQNANGAVTPAVSLTSTGTDKNGNYFASAGSGLLYVRVVASAWTSGTAYVYTAKHRGTYVSSQDFWDTAMPFTRDAVFAIDASRSSVGETVVVNAGSGGTALNATLGSTGSADSNDPLLLPWTGTNYLYCPGVVGNYASAPGSAALDITGDIEIVVRVAMDDWTPTAAQVFASRINFSTNSSYRFLITSAGMLQFDYCPTSDWAVAINKAATVAVPFADGTAGWVKVTFAVATGVASFYSSTDGVSFSLLSATSSTGATSIGASTSALSIASSGSGSGNLSGKFYRAIVRNGIGGPTVFDADFTTGITSGAQTTFTESSSNAATVTINRGTAGRKCVAVTRPVWLFGTDDYMVVPDNALINFNTTDDYTVLVVARLWDTQTSFVKLLQKQLPLSPTGNKGWDIRVNVWPSVGGSIGDGSAAGNFNQFSSTIAATSGALMSVGSKRTGTSFNGFMNNTLSSTQTNSYDTTAVVAMAIGAGAIDMELLAVAVFRRALNATEIASINTYYGTA